MNRSPLSSAARLLLLALAPLALPARATATLPAENVLVVVADDIGVDYIGRYGLGVFPAHTPTLDALADNGVLFRNVWATPICSPTRGTLQTGRYPFRYGVGHSQYPQDNWALPLTELSIPKVLDAHPALGYSHALVGKWHLSSDSIGGDLGPNLLGWSHYAGALWNFESGKAYYDWPMIENGFASTNTTYATTAEVDEALDWIATVPEPWVVHLNFHAAHTPYHTPPAHLHTAELGYFEPRTRRWLFYRAAIEALDSELNRLLAGLGDARARTNVIVVSDNGTPNDVSIRPFLPSHAKGTPYEGGLRVPMIVSGPSVISPGREEEALVSAVDIMPTVLEMCGLQVPADLPPGESIDGVSFLPYLKTPGTAPLRTHLFSEMFRPHGVFDQTTHTVVWRMIRDERHKLIVRGPAPLSFQLYDLELDPFEKRDLYPSLAAAPFGGHLAGVFASLYGELVSIVGPNPGG